MIFMTVGSQMLFGRLFKAGDACARDHRAQTFVAQIRNSDYSPQFMEYTKTLAPSRFTERMADASVVVANAGMRMITRAAEHGTPMILLPRRSALRETGNIHLDRYRDD